MKFVYTSSMQKQWYNVNLMALKQDGVHSVLFPKQGDKIESAVLHRVMHSTIFLS